MLSLLLNVLSESYLSEMILQGKKGLNAHIIIYNVKTYDEI